VVPVVESVQLGSARYALRRAGDCPVVEFEHLLECANNEGRVLQIGMGVNLAESGVDGVQLKGRGLEHKKRPVLPSVSRDCQLP
jgi:hypothetical protein